MHRGGPETSRDKELRRAGEEARTGRRPAGNTGGHRLLGSWSSSILWISSRDAWKKARASLQFRRTLGEARMLRRWTSTEESGELTTQQNRRWRAEFQERRGTHRRGRGHRWNSGGASSLETPRELSNAMQRSRRCMIYGSWSGRHRGRPVEEENTVGVPEATRRRNTRGRARGSSRITSLDFASHPVYPRLAPGFLVVFPRGVKTNVEAAV